MTEPLYWRYAPGDYMGDPLPRAAVCQAGDEAGPDGVTVTHRFNGKFWEQVDDEEGAA